MATKQILLNAKACSGRGVRVRSLSPSERMAVLETAAKEVGAEATLIELRLKESMGGIASFVVAVTAKSGLKTQDDLVKAEWKPLQRKDLEDNLEAYFTQPDIDALQRIFQKLHTVTEAEAEKILGEAQDVAED